MTYSLTPPLSSKFLREKPAPMTVDFLVLLAGKASHSTLNFSTRPVPYSGELSLLESLGLARPRSFVSAAGRLMHCTVSVERCLKVTRINGHHLDRGEKSLSRHINHG